jgi:hypothetical protein
LPDAAALRDKDKAVRIAACETIRSLLSRGGQWQEGRRRAGGKQSIKWQPNLIGPQLRRHVPKRKAESEFVLGLQLAYLIATGRTAFTAHPENMGPFARIASYYLRLIAGPGPNAAEIINELQRRRKAVEKLLQLQRSRRTLLRDL